jgi:hypothetical protein
MLPQLIVFQSPLALAKKHEVFREGMMQVTRV